VFGKKKGGAAPAFTKLFFATDLHGSDRTFRKFVNAGKLYGADVLILGGDVTGKVLIPIIKDGNGSFRATVSDVKREVRTIEELAGLQELISGMGFYHEVMEHETYDLLTENPEKVEEMFAVKARERLIRWIAHADEQLEKTGLLLYMTGGNDDDQWVIDALNTHQTDRVINPEGKVVHLDGIHRMVSIGLSNPTPWKTPREEEEDVLRKVIEASVEGIEDFSNVVFNVHAPPKDCTLDLAPLLDTRSNPPRPVVRAGQSVMVGVGSVAVREAVERYQPLLALVGHIHESRGIVKIGRTTVINPGSEYGEGILRGAIVNMQDGKLLGYQFTSG
jgi:Icc-related predicted phosphoesterase